MQHSIFIEKLELQFSVGFVFEVVESTIAQGDGLGFEVR